MSSHERLDMEQQNKTSNTTFKQKKGFFVQRWLLAIIIVAAALCLLLVGLLVGYLSPCRQQCLYPTSEGLQDKDPTQEPSKQHPYAMLPRSIVPVHYDITLQPFLIPDNFTFSGTVKILIQVLQDTDNITVHINDITVMRDSVKLVSVTGDSAPDIRDISQDKLRDFYILHLKSNLKAEEKYQVEMNYTGNLNDLLNGFYRSHYKDKNKNKRWLATTQFEPTDARKAFPCFDEPALKATFNITIVRWRNMTSMSNMPIYKTEDRGEDWVADYFETTVRMSTYLLAFVVSDFVKNGTPEFAVWSRAEAINTTAYALDIGPKILKFYEEFFAIKYPLPKMDMVAIPDFSAGAMENWGLVTYRETALLYDPRYSSTGNKYRVANIIAHELAHQWFGNLVTPKWWDDLWLNEGFASYVEYLGVEAVHPNWEMDQHFVVNDLQNVMDLDCLRTSHPISVPVGHPDEINEIFDRISYGKGATIIRMMRYFLGNETFQKGVSNYLNAKQFENAVQDDLWSHLTDAQEQGSNRIDVKRVMDSWTLQTGYPVITVIRDYASGTATIAQKRFLLDQANESSSELWEVPFTYTHAANVDWEAKTKLWLNKTNGNIKDLPGENHWFIANVQEAGYYKVNYDIQNWNLLLKQLNEDHKKIHTVNRAQILDDSMDLARAGLLDYDVALNTTLYLIKERDFLPWKSVLDSLSHIDSMICRSAIYGKWQKYMVRQLQPLYDWLGWTDSEDDDILKQFLRATTLAWLCSYEHSDCITHAQDLFNRWRNDTGNLMIIHPNLRSVVYCAAVRHGGEDVWSFFWQQYLAATVASEKNKFMYALACAKEPWLLTRYLNWSLAPESGIRRQDGSSVFGAVGSKLYGRDLTFNYFRDKWNKIFGQYGKSFFAISSMLKSVTSSLNTQFELVQLKDFYKGKKGNVGASKRAFEQSIEKATANVQWMEKNYEQIAKWLDNLDMTAASL